MHLYKAVVAALLAAAPAIRAEVNFEQYDVTKGTSNPRIVQENWSVTVAGKATGLGSDGPYTRFFGYTEGDIETVCINGGHESPPGQNKDPITLTGSVEGTTVADHQGSYEYDLVMSEDCSCGKEGQSFDYTYKLKGVTTDYTLTCKGPLGGTYSGDPWYVPGDGGICCGAVRAGDNVNCGGCLCRVGDMFKSCPNGRKNVNYAQYAIGILVNRTIVDAVVRSSSAIDADIKTIKRQECFASDGKYGKVDGTDEIKPTDVTCFQCQICKDSNGNGANANECLSNSYPNDYPALSDGCYGYVTVPVDPTGPVV